MALFSFIPMDKITIADRLKVAGKELLKLNVGNVVKSFGFPDYALANESFFIGSNSFNGGLPIGNPMNNTGWSFGIGGNPDTYFDFNQSDSSLKAYLACPPIAAICMQKAQAMVNGNTYVMDKNGKEAVGPLADKVRNTLLQPNPLQSGDHFEMQWYINTLIYGFTVILPIKPTGFDILQTTKDVQLWAIPGNLLEVIVNEESAPFKGAQPFKSITVVYGNERTPLPLDDVFIIKDTTPSFTSFALPASRIQSIAAPINNVIGAMQSRGVLIASRGPRYVVSNAAKDSVGTIAMQPDEKREVEQNFARTYGLLRGQSQAIITSASLNVTPIGFDVKQLGLLEEVVDSSSQICLGLGFPKFLAGLSDPTFNNQDTAEKALYQRFIMPEAKSFYGQLNKLFNTAKYGLLIQKDFSEIPVLAEDKTNLGRARFYMNQACQIEWLNNIITANQWLEANGLDAVTDGEQYYYQWIAAGKQFGKAPAGAASGSAGGGNTVTDNPNEGTPQ